MQRPNTSKFLKTASLLLLAALLTQPTTAANDTNLEECKLAQETLFSSNSAVSDSFTAFGKSFAKDKCKLLGLGGILTPFRDSDTCTLDMGDNETISFDMRANYAPVWNGKYDDEDGTYAAYKDACDAEEADARMCAMSFNMTVIATSEEMGEFTLTLDVWHAPICTANECSEDEALMVVQQEAVKRAIDNVESAEERRRLTVKQRRLASQETPPAVQQKPSLGARHLVEGNDLCADLDTAMLSKIEEVGVGSIKCFAELTEFNCDEEDINLSVERVPTLLSSSSFRRSNTMAFVLTMGVVVASFVAL